VLILKLELKPSLQERSLKAFLDLAILSALADRHMTGYEINNLFVKKFGILISPNMIYYKFTSMERKGWIECTRNRAGRAYALTKLGHEMVDGMERITEEIQSFIKTILRTQRNPEPANSR